MNEPITINPNRIDLDEAYMQMAEVWAKRSKANRKQVGALIVKDRQIISDGYNGMPAGAADDVCEVDGRQDEYSYRAQWGTARPPLKPTDLTTKREVLHAESNALMKISENGGVGAQGATLYVTMSPCFECAKLIKQAKVRRVIFRELYRDTSGIELLQQLGVEVHQLGPTPDRTGLPTAKLPDAAPTEVPVRPTPPASRVIRENGTQVSGPPPSILDQSAGTEMSRLRSLAAVAGRPAPVQGPTIVEQPVVPPVQGPTIVEQPAVPPVDGPVIINDVNAALAEAGILLVDGVPVARPTAPAPAPKQDEGYQSPFM